MCILKAQVPGVSMRAPLCTDADDLLRCSATVGNLGLILVEILLVNLVFLSILLQLVLDIVLFGAYVFFWFILSGSALVLVMICSGIDAIVVVIYVLSHVYIFITVGNIQQL